jgi:hypothetical protein
MVKTEPFDAASYLTSARAQTELLNDALASAQRKLFRPTPLV